jgi:hypothetical protein
MDRMGPANGPANASKEKEEKMNRKLKALGLALVAVFAMSALASAAQADGTPEYFHSSFEETVLTGNSVEGATGDQVFTPKPEGAAITCHTASFEGKADGTANGNTYTTAEEVTVHPQYSSCDKFAGQNVTVNTHKCHYDLSPTTEGESEMATVSIVKCPSATNKETGEGPIEIIVEGLATIKIANQALPKAVAYENVGGHVRVNATATGIAFTCAPALACALGGVPSSGSEGTYTGDVTVRGYEYLGGTTGGYEEGAEATVSQG